MEPRFGHSFAEVRVHPGERGHAAAAAVGGPAFSVGRDIAFAGERYDVETPSGLALLAHELTHVVQHERAGGVTAGLPPLSSRGDPAESEADGVMAGTLDPAGISARPSATIAKAPGDEQRAKEAGGFLGGLSSASNLGESWYEGLVQGDWWKKMETTKDAERLINRSAARDVFGIMGDTFGTLSGGFNLASGIGRLLDGGGVEAGLDTAKGALDTTSGVAGNAGRDPVPWTHGPGPAGGRGRARGGRARRGAGAAQGNQQRRSGRSDRGRRGRGSSRPPTG